MCILIYLFIYCRNNLFLRRGFKGGDESHISPVVFHLIFCDQVNKNLPISTLIRTVI